MGQSPKSQHALRPLSGKTRIQAIVGPLLFYARGVDPTILPAVNMVASLQASPTQHVAAAALRVLRYCVN